MPPGVCGVVLTARSTSSVGWLGTVAACLPAYDGFSALAKSIAMTVARRRSDSALA
jgi:hypothetical protein